MLVRTPDWIRPLIHAPRPAIVMAMPSREKSTFWRASPSSLQRVTSSGKPFRPAGLDVVSGLPVASTVTLTTLRSRESSGEDLILALPFVLYRRPARQPSNMVDAA